MPGGASDKLGNIYEGLWTIDCMIDVIDEQGDEIEIESISLPELDKEATTMCIEPLGEEGKGVEFWLQKEDIREYHQVKRQISEGKWTISSLENNQNHVLSDFQNKLNKPLSHCIFVSMNSASELRELSDRARSSKDWAQFSREVLSKGWRNSFSKLCSKWSDYTDKEIEEIIKDFQNQKRLSEPQERILKVAEDSYEKLKRVYVETISDNQLKKKVEARLRGLIEPKSNDLSSHEDWKKARISLGELASKSIHQQLTANHIWKWLDEKGYRRSNYSKNPHVLGKIKKANQLYLSGLERQQNFTTIPREEVQEILDLLLKDEDKRGFLLVGEAGVGKSGVMAQIAGKLNEKNIIFFAFRLDNLTIEFHPDNVGRNYNLPLSPAIVLGNISKNTKSKCVLIIDQLDALSQASGRHPKFFDCINRIIEEASDSDFPHVRVLVACRKFDLENDSRIKSLTGKKGILQEFEIKKLSEKQVRETIQIQNLGIDDKKLNRKQIELLSLPLHLSLLVEISKDSTVETLSFETENDLFNQFWEYQQRHCKVGKFTKIIDKLCYYMNSKQKLSAPKSVLDEYFNDAETMISENILIQENKTIRFFHETFFDYAFARRFTAEGKELLSFLLEGEQHLFNRAQVRQILHHNREIDFPQYLDDVTALLNRENIRFHLKYLVIDLLADLQDPKPEEWEIIKPFLKENDQKLKDHAWRLLRYPKWFILVKNSGIIEQWLQCDDDFLVDKAVHRVVHLITFVDTEVMDEIPALIEPFIDNPSEQWLKRLLFIVERISIGNKSRKVLDLFLTLIDQGILDTDEDFFHKYHVNSNSKSEWICEIIGHYLERRLKLHFIKLLSFHAHFICLLKIHPFFLKQYTNLNLQMGLNPFYRYGYNQGTIPYTQWDNIFLESGKKASKEYVVNILPFMLSVIELTSIKTDEKPYQDQVWYYAINTGYASYRLQSAILHGMKIALSNLAKNHPQEFDEVIREYNLSSSESETIQFLLECASRSTLTDEQDLRSQTSPNPEDYEINSPIPEAQTANMNDEQWLEAIQTNDQGVYQLSKNLQQEVIKDPERFAKLIDQFPDNTNIYYFQAILRGIAETTIEIAVETALRVCQYYHQLPGKPYGYDISRLIEKLAYLPWDKQGLEIIAYYALNDPDPKQGCRKIQFDNVNNNDLDEILTEGINSVRGRAVCAIAELIFKDKDRTNYFKTTLEQIVKDSSLWVRSCVAIALTAVLNYDRNLAVNLFKKLVEAEDILLGTQTVERFLKYALWTHYTELEYILKRMLDSELSKIQEMGSRLLFLASLVHSEAQPLAEEYLSGTPAHRKGAALIYRSNFHLSKYRELCEKSLIQLFNDPDKEVQKEVARFFNDLDDEKLANSDKLIEAFINSSVFLDNSFHLLQSLTEAAKFDQEIALKVCERFVEVFITESGGGYASESEDVGKITEKIYSQTRDSGLKSRCLDIFDRLYELGAYGLDQVTQEYDR